MKNTWRRYLLILSVLFLLLPLTAVAEKSESTSQQESVVDVEKAAEQADEAVAELSAEKKKLLATWLHLLDSAEDADDSTVLLLEGSTPDLGTADVAAQTPKNQVKLI